MSARVVLPQAVHRRAAEPHQLPRDLRLRALEWAIYFAVTGHETVAELGRRLRAAEDARDEAVQRLVALGLLVEQELDAASYVRALAAAGDEEPRTLRDFLSGAMTPAAEHAQAAAPKLAAAHGSVHAHTQEIPAPRPQLREATPPGQRPPSRPMRVASPLAFTPLPSPDDRKENHPMSRSRKLSLRALMNLIETKAGSREAGQLDIYRVFVRVDTLLLRRSGIETLRFTEDHLVSDPELEQAIVSSVRKTLGVECPESLWVDVA